MKLGIECHLFSHHCPLGPCHPMRLAAYMMITVPPVPMVTVCHSWPALANLVPFQVLFLLRFPMELLRSTSCVPFWCRRHSQMPLSWPKPLRRVVPKWISRAPPYSGLLGCCPGTGQGFSSRTGSPQETPSDPALLSGTTASQRSPPSPSPGPLSWGHHPYPTPNPH